MRNFTPMRNDKKRTIYFLPQGAHTLNSTLPETGLIVPDLQFLCTAVHGIISLLNLCSLYKHGYLRVETRPRKSIFYSKVLLKKNAFIPTLSSRVCTYQIFFSLIIHVGFKTKFYFSSITLA